MRAFIIFVVACIALASARSTFKREPATSKTTLLQRILNKAQSKTHLKLEARLAKIKQAIETHKRTDSGGEDNDQSGSSAMDCDIPCANADDFITCVGDETLSILTEFEIIRFALAGDDLFGDDEISELLEVRFDSSMGIEDRKEFENGFYEQAEEDFFDGLEEEDFDEATWSVIEDLDCRYMRLREEYYKRLEE